MALITGGRRGFNEFIAFAEKIAAKGFRVLLHDRRNTGASDVLIAGADGEEEIWADDLAVLLGKLQAELDAIKAAVAPDEVKAIDMLTVLRGIFGSAVLETALDRLATSTTANQKTTQPP